MTQPGDAKRAGVVTSCGPWWEIYFYLVYLEQIRSYLFLWVTPRYDTHAWLLIRPYEKQQVDVRKAINHSANMAANKPAAFPFHFVFLFFFFCFEDKLLLDMHSEQMHTEPWASHARLAAHQHAVPFCNHTVAGSVRLCSCLSTQTPGMRKLILCSRAV